MSTISRYDMKGVSSVSERDWETEMNEYYFEVRTACGVIMRESEKWKDEIEWGSRRYVCKIILVIYGLSGLIFLVITINISDSFV
jgi:hypothetical protein